MLLDSAVLAVLFWRGLHENHHWTPLLCAEIWVVLCFVGLGVSLYLSTAAFAVADEYGAIQPSGPVSLGGGGSYSFTIMLQASRNGTDLDGRHYTITVSARDFAGNLGSGSAVVIVPHDLGN